MFIGIFPPERVKDKHHITLTFNGHGENKQEYLKCVVALASTAVWWNANGLGRIQIEFGGIKQFGTYCSYAEVLSKKLHHFQEKLIENLDMLEVYHAVDYQYTPHLTLAYGKEQDGIDNPYEGTSFSVPTLSVISSAFGRSDIQV